MGTSASALRPDEIEEMQKSTNFTSREIKRLYERFKKLDKDNSGTISKNEFMMIPELAVNPLSERIVALFCDSDSDDASVNFKQFLQALSVFSSKASKEEKLKFAFKVYDIDNDGYITSNELYKILSMMVGDNLTDVQLQQIVDKTIYEADEDKDGKISPSEFSKVISDADLETKMTIRF